MARPSPDGVLSIVEPGDYVLSGTFSGRIEVEVDKEENEKVRLVFDGVALETQTPPRGLLPPGR